MLTALILVDYGFDLPEKHSYWNLQEKMERSNKRSKMRKSEKKPTEKNEKC